MFRTHFQYRAAENEGGDGGGGGDAGALAARRAAGKGNEGGGDQVTPADARAYVTNYVADPEGLKAMKDEDVVKYAGRLKTFNDKAVSDAMTAAALKLEQRPDWLPEALYDAEKKTLRHDAMVKSWKDTRSELDKIKGANGIKPPEKAELYTFERPKDLPAHILAGDVTKDESLKLLREVAFEVGLSQEQFGKLAAGYYARASKLVPAPVDAKAEIAKLGENGEKVADTVITWLEGFETSGLLSAAEVDALVLQGATADGIRGLNKLRENFGGSQIPINASVDGLPSKDELYQLVKDDRYTGKNGKGDEAFRAKVKHQFEQVFGTGPAGASEGGRVG